MTDDFGEAMRQAQAMARDMVAGDPGAVARVDQIAAGLRDATEKLGVDLTDPTQLRTFFAALRIFYQQMFVRAREAGAVDINEVFLTLWTGTVRFMDDDA